jgi:ATP citrate (pro-S)-lyase
MAMTPETLFHAPHPHNPNSIEEAARKHPKADIFINYASMRSASESSMEALKQPTIRTVAIIAEGVPERDTKHLIAFARANNKIIIGPATVGGVQVGSERSVCLADDYN